MAQDPKEPPAGAPGAGAAGGFPFSPQDALEFMQRMWNPLGLAMPGFAPPAAAAPAPAGLPFPNPAAMFAAHTPDHTATLSSSPAPIQRRRRRTHQATVMSVAGPRVW